MKFGAVVCRVGAGSTWVALPLNVFSKDSTGGAGGTATSDLSTINKANHRGRVSRQVRRRTITAHARHEYPIHHQLAGTRL